MSKFERIVRDVLVMGGQARIRDTEITVNEIVRLSLDGKSQSEILEKFPQLEAEDVHQALGWKLEWSEQLTMSYLYESRAPLVSIRGYSDLIPIVLSQGTNPEGVIEMLEHVKHNSERMYDLIQGLMTELQNRGWHGDLPLG